MEPEPEPEPEPRTHDIRNMLFETCHWKHAFRNMLFGTAKQAFKPAKLGRGPCSERFTCSPVAMFPRGGLVGEVLADPLGDVGYNSVADLSVAV